MQKHLLILDLHDHSPSDELPDFSVEVSSADYKIRTVVGFEFNELGIATVRANNNEACLLPGVHGDLHLISLVTGAIYAAFDDECVIYSDVFMTPGGEWRKLEIITETP